MLAWDEKLSVGNATIDSEHKNLIVLVNNLSSIIKEKDCALLLQAFEQLEHSLCEHFDNEELIAKAVSFDFTKNKLEHEKVLKELRKMRDEIVALNGVWSNRTAKQYSEFLSDWITGHVLEEDMLMKPVLQTYNYNFLPNH